MGNTRLSSSPFLAALCLGLLFNPGVQAQDPDSVDIDLRTSTGDANSLEVYVRSNGQGFGDVLSTLTFSIRWVTTSPATLGPRVNSCPSGIGINPTNQVTNPLVDGVPTGFNYRTYNAFGASLLSDVGCALPQDEWFQVMTVPVQNNTGCTEFQIVNDDWTDSPGNASDFYLSLGGIDKTGSIEPTSALIGACAADCLGTIGGPALPGSACDDSDPLTGNDIYSNDCLCAGQLIDCMGVPGGPALPGAACDDGNPDTEGDIYNDQCLCAGVSMAIPDRVTTGPMVRILPNPSTEPTVLLHAEAGNAGASAQVDIEVFNPLGQRVHAERVSMAKGILNHRLDLGADIGQGVYLVNVTMEGRTFTQRLVIQ